MRCGGKHIAAVVNDPTWPSYLTDVLFNFQSASSGSPCDEQVPWIRWHFVGEYGYASLPRRRKKAATAKEVQISIASHQFLLICHLMSTSRINFGFALDFLLFQVIFPSNLSKRRTFRNIYGYHYVFICLSWLGRTFKNTVHNWSTLQSVVRSNACWLQSTATTIWPIHKLCDHKSKSVLYQQCQTVKAK